MFLSITHGYTYQILNMYDENPYKSDMSKPEKFWLSTSFQLTSVEDVVIIAYMKLFRTKQSFSGEIRIFNITLIFFPAYSSSAMYISKNGF